jgi:hypothetical protein
VPRGFSGSLDHPRVETTVIVTGYRSKARAQRESVIVSQRARLRRSFLDESVKHVRRVTAMRQCCHSDGFSDATASTTS